MKGGSRIAPSPSHRVVKIAVLRLLAASPRELGASSLRRDLLKTGIDVSEATIGRMLREFDIRGYTERNGKLGRKLTAQGAWSLEALEVEFERESGSREITAMLSVRDEAEFVMVLEARRAIERETSRLAAVRATPTEIKEMKKATAVHMQGVLSGALVTKHDASLHRLIARSADNFLLEKLLDLIRQDREVAAVVRKARERGHLQCASEHRAIVDAIGARDPVAAEQAMMGHLDNLIEAVQSSFAHGVPSRGGLRSARPAQTGEDRPKRTDGGHALPVPSLMAEAAEDQTLHPALSPERQKPKTGGGRGQ